MRSILQDVRYGLRLIRRSPGFAAVTIMILALGIGANTAIFSALNALFLRSLPVPQPDRLVELVPIYRNGSQVPFSYPMFQLLQQNQRVFSGLWGGAFGSRNNVEADGIPFLANVRGVTGNYYGELGASPLLGRLIAPADAANVPGATVAVIDYEFWQSRFGGDPKVIGKEIRIEGELFTVVGVTRKWFSGMMLGEAPGITIPITAGPFAKNTTVRSLLWVSVTGRLKEGVTLQQARGQLHSFWHEALLQTAPTTVPGLRLQSWLATGLDVRPAATGVNRRLREHFARPLRVLMGRFRSYLAGGVREPCRVDFGPSRGPRPGNERAHVAGSHALADHTPTPRGQCLVIQLRSAPRSRIGRLGRPFAGGCAR